MELIQRINEYIGKHKLIEAQQTVIVGFSGGPDSVFLLHTLVRLRNTGDIKIIAAHLDHEWRANSAEDALFCAHLCRQLNIQFIAARASLLGAATQDNGSLEDTGRQLRRAFFERVAQEQSANAIALAHHADDQIETFFIRLARGTTVNGLSCMRPRDGQYIRPLLACRKKEIVAYLDAHKIAYLTDPTNTDTRFLRNRIRHMLMPTLEAVDARLPEHIRETIESAAQTNEFMRTHLTAACISVIEPESKTIDIDQLRQETPFVQQQLITHWLRQHGKHGAISHALIEEIRRYLLSSHAPTHQIGTWHMNKKNGRARIDG